MFDSIIIHNGRVLFEKGESDDFVDAFNMCNDMITSITNEGLIYSSRIAVSGLGGNLLNTNVNYNNTNSLRQAREQRQGISPRRR